jgi:hypothetical protein
LRLERAIGETLSGTLAAGIGSLFLVLGLGALL